MPRKKEGYSQLNIELPDDLIEAIRRIAEEQALKVNAWVAATCAAAVGVDYEPARLGRPATPPPPPPPPKGSSPKRKPRRG